MDRTRDPLGRLPVATEDGPACGDRHWLGLACQAEVGHDGRCRHYQDGGRYEWRKPGGSCTAPVVLVRPEEGGLS